VRTQAAGVPSSVPQGHTAILSKTRLVLYRLNTKKLEMTLVLPLRKWSDSNLPTPIVWLCCSSRTNLTEYRSRISVTEALGSRKGQDPVNLKAQQQESNHIYSNPHRKNFESLADRRQQ